MHVCREREFQISSYKSVQLQDSQVLYFTFVLFFGNLFFSSHKTISWYILAYHTSNKCEYMTLILNNRLLSGRTQKGKLLADFHRHQWQISSVMVGKEEEETEVFLETLARLLIDPAIGHFKLGCFNQPRNSSIMAFSFYVFFSDRTLLCLVVTV